LLSYNAIRTLQKVDGRWYLVTQFGDKHLHLRGMLYGRSSPGTITVPSTTNLPRCTDTSDLQTPCRTSAPATGAGPFLKNRSCV
jgi:hypothetical protein